ncbi:MAG TPA: hypothetical protein PLA43_12615 [Bryobacteraceae bacterium]|nr:hypothetical protein [Bryobacteraceae bacterium]HOQ46097.1 hypothetical protein [Bryobacteraceae bacterium]HPU72792.1 hypothetical protein [Bryobacteraceae bacterium]
MIALLCVALGRPQAQDPQRPSHLQALVDAARALPAEYHADALLRLAATPAVADPAWKLELLEEAFSVAPNALNLYKRRCAAQTPRNTREWLLGQAFNLEVDTLSLQCRAVRGMLPLDARRAREMFARIPALTPPQTGCESALIPDLRLFYETLQLVAGNDPSLIMERIRMISSPAELAPAAALIRSAKLSPDDRLALITAYADRLAVFARNSESLGSAARDPELASQPVALAEAARREGIAVDGLMRAYREFLAACLGGTRCEEPAGSLAASWLERFNEKLRLPGYLVSTELLPIPPENIRPQTMRPAAETQLYASPEARELDSRLRRLRTLSDSASHREEDWRAEAQHILGALEQWTAEGGDIAVHFHEKAGFYFELLETAPAGPASARIAASCVAFFANHPLAKAQPLEYLFELQRLLSLARRQQDAAPRAAGPFEIIERPGGSSAALASELANPRDPVIAVYAALEQAAR